MVNTKRFHSHPAASLLAWFWNPWEKQKIRPHPLWKAFKAMTSYHTIEWGYISRAFKITFFMTTPYISLLILPVFLIYRPIIILFFLCILLSISSHQIHLCIMIKSGHMTYLDRFRKQLLYLFWIGCKLRSNVITISVNFSISLVHKFIFEPLFLLNSPQCVLENNLKYNNFPAASVSESFLTLFMQHFPFTLC